MANASIESFNGTLRDGRLNVHWFDELTDVQKKLQAWRRECNEYRSRRALDGLSSLEFKDRCAGSWLKICWRTDSVHRSLSEEMGNWEFAHD